jgi:hypothetical protein
MCTDFTGHPFRFEIDNKERLATHDLLRVCPFLSDSGQNPSSVIAEPDDQPHQLV